MFSAPPPVTQLPAEPQDTGPTEANRPMASDAEMDTLVALPQTPSFSLAMNTQL